MGGTEVWDKERFVQALQEGWKSLSVPLGASEVEAFAQFAEMVWRTNQRMNLTRITAPEEMAVRHFIDSATVLIAVDWPAASTVVDVGTGAGFPGVVLQILRPYWRVVLVESVRKKASFVEEAVAALRLPALVLSARAEELGQDPAWREQAEGAVARAVAPLPVLLEYLLPLLRVGGQLVALKGPEGEREVADAQGALRVLGGQLARVVAWQLPDGSERRLVVVEKVRPTPREYPRRPGLAEKRPLV